MDETAKKIEIIRRLYQRLHRFLSGLSQQEMAHPSACDLWQVQDVAAHLTGRAQRQIASMTRGLRGDSGPPPGFVTQQAPAAGGAQADVGFREELGDQLLPTFLISYDQLYQLLQEITGAGWEKLCWHPRRGSMTARQYVDQRIQELAIHDWDIRSGLDAEARLDPASVPTLLEMVPNWLRMSFCPQDTLARSEAFRFHIADLPKSFDVIVAGDSFQIGELSSAEPDLMVSCDPNSYLLFMFGRLGAESGLKTKRLDTQGDVSLLPRFSQWFKGF